MPSGPMHTWNPLNEPIDWVDFAGQATPGLAEIVGAGSPRRWDKRESVGWSGAFLVYMGQELSSFSVLIKLYTEDDWLDWFAFAPLVKRVPLGKYQRPLAVTHPLLGMLGIFAAVVEDVTQAVQVEDGVWQIEIKMIEYRSPRVALAAARATKSAPDDPEDAVIEDRRQAFDALGQEVEAVDRANGNL